MLVFQKGVGSSLFGFQDVPVIESWIPLFLFAILFGLLLGDRTGISQAGWNGCSRSASRGSERPSRLADLKASPGTNCLVDSSK